MKRDVSVCLFVTVLIFTFFPEISPAEPESDADIQCGEKLADLFPFKDRWRKKLQEMIPGIRLISMLLIVREIPSGCLTTAGQPFC